MSFLTKIAPSLGKALSFASKIVPLPGAGIVGDIAGKALTNISNQQTQQKKQAAAQAAGFMTQPKTAQQQQAGAKPKKSLKEMWEELPMWAKIALPVVLVGGVLVLIFKRKKRR